jgi:hypothetical protein
MHKDELIQLHSLLSQVKRYLETDNVETQENFAEYRRLGVAPQHIHKSKTQHKKAVFLLGQEIAGVVAQRLPSGPERERLIDWCNRLAQRANGNGNGHHNGIGNGGMAHPGVQSPLRMTTARPPST